MEGGELVRLGGGVFGTLSRGLLHRALEFGEGGRWRRRTLIALRRFLCHSAIRSSGHFGGVQVMGMVPIGFIVAT